MIACIIIVNIELASVYRSKLTLRLHFYQEKFFFSRQFYAGISIYQVGNQGRSPLILWGNKLNLSKGNIITIFMDEAHACSKLIKKKSTFFYIIFALKIYSILHNLAVTFFNLFS